MKSLIIAILTILIVFFSCKKEEAYEEEPYEESTYEPTWSCPGSIGISLILKDSITNNPVVETRMVTTNPYAPFSTYTDSLGMLGFSYIWDPCRKYDPVSKQDCVWIFTDRDQAYYGQWKEDFTGYNDGDSKNVEALLSRSGVIKFNLVDTTFNYEYFRVLEFKMGTNTWSNSDGGIHLIPGVDTTLFRYVIPNRGKRFAYKAIANNMSYTMIDTIVYVGSGDTVEITSYPQ